ncbi:mitochondrial-processing peptidase subunit alpha, partial [Trichonephila clavata]
MNANRFRQVLINKKKLFSTAKLRPAQSATQAEADIELLTKQDAQISQISSGITVASVENYSPITQVSAVIKAGSRYETAHNLGLVHFLRHCAVLSTKNHSGFVMTRELEMIGAKLNVTATRDHLIYNLKGSRDSIDKGLAILADIVTNPAFKPWELKEASEILPLDLALHQKQPESVLLEALHKAAFRGGLSNSLFSEPFMIGKHNPDMCHSFVRGHFTASRTSIVGLGIAHEDLEGSVGEHFNFQGGAAESDGVSKFSPGEIRIEADIPLTYAAVVAEGAG